MHIPPLFAEERLEEIRRIIQSSPLATLVTDSRDRLEANLLPLEWFDASERGQLRGHVARNHPLFSNTRPGSDSLVVFQGPNAYISPRWYVNGQKSRRVAPSWNYVAVEVRGKIRFIDDSDWIRKHLTSLTATQESTREQPWSLADAAPEFLEEVSARLIGFAIDIEEVNARRMLSQQRTEADRLSLVENLSREISGSARDLGKLIVP